MRILALQTIINKYERNSEYTNRLFTLQEAENALKLALKHEYLKLD